MVKTRCFKHFNDLDFTNTIKNIDWDKLCSIDNVNDALYQSACFCRKKVEHGLSFPEFKNHVAVKPTRFHRAQYSD